MIYLFDKNEKLIKLVKKDAIKSALQKFTLTTEKYVSDRLTVEMKNLTAQELEQVEYMAIQSIEDAHKFHFFYIAQKFSEKLTTLIGVQSGIEELRKSVVLDKRPKNSFARPVIDDLLVGTNWQARFVGENSQHSTNFYYISTFDALKKVCDVWNLEMQFFVEMNGNKIGARYIDFKQKIGEATGKRVVYGHNALQILQEVERTNLFTALIGRGKGEEVTASNNEGGQAGYGRRLSFENVVWEKAKGAPVDKPKGQKYVELPEMTKKYGIKNADGTMRAKVGFAVFQEEEDANVLLKRTYEQLVNAARPQLTLKTSTVYLKGVNIGDTIRVVRHDKKLDYDTRIFEITFNRLNNESSDIKLGDRISESNEAKIQNIASQKADELISTSFNSLIKNLPDFLPSADGLNKNWYGVNDPTKTHVGKVGINDIWFKPNPEHEGQTIMLRWTGEVWQEVIRSNTDQEIIDKINKQFESLYLADINEARSAAKQALRTAGANADLANEAKRISERISGDITTFKSDYRADLDGINLRITQTTANNVQMFSTFTSDINGRMAQMAIQVEGKVNQADFQSVKETAQLYERILGGAENDVSNNVSRMVMSNQIFQTEVGKYSIMGGPNMLRNSRADDGLKYWTDDNGRLGFTAHPFYFNSQKRMFELRPGAFVKSPRFIVKRNADYTLNILGFDNNSKYLKIYFCKRKKSSTADFEEKQLVFDGRPQWTNGPVFNNEKTVKKSFKFNIGDFDDGYLQFEYDRNNPNKWGGLFMTELDFYEGTNDRKWQPAPEDSAEPIEAVRTQMTLLADSWAVRSLNSAGDILGQLNLNKDGSVHINEALVAVGEKTYIQDGVIKKSMIGKAQIGTAHIDEIDASQARLINVSAKNIVADGLTANIIRGGKLSSLNGQSNFDLQSGWLEMNQAGIGIRNKFAGRPLQYLVFGQGSIHGKDGSYTALMSNSNNKMAMDDGSAGIQIWNAADNTTAINLYGDEIALLYNADDKGGIVINNITNGVSGLGDVQCRNVLLTGYGNHNLKALFNDIYQNLRILHANKQSAYNYSYSMYGPI